ncbi:MAG: hypothetical protein ACO3NZ_04180 [Pirellulales bacterium]
MALVIAVFAAGGGGLPRVIAGDPDHPFVGDAPRVTVMIAGASCCGDGGSCCCRAESLPMPPAVPAKACCSDADAIHVAAAIGDADPLPQSGSSDSPFCSCNTEQQLPLEGTMPFGSPAAPTDFDVHRCVTIENRVASDELLLATTPGSVPMAAAPLPLPVLLQLATLCCWRA